MYWSSESGLITDSFENQKYICRNNSIKAANELKIDQKRLLRPAACAEACRFAVSASTMTTTW